MSRIEPKSDIVLSGPGKAHPQILRRHVGWPNNKWIGFAGFVLVAVLCALGAWLIEDVRGRASSEDSVEDVKHTTDGQQTLPLETAYGTSSFGKPQIQRLRRGQATSLENDLTDIFTKSFRQGSSSVFLVRADDTSEAIRATRLVFAGCHSVEGPVPLGAESTPGQYWVVAYLGIAGSRPAAWIIHEVNRNEDAIRIVTSKAAGGATDDLHQYFLWVPLGPLAGGEIRLELFDQSTKRVTLMRSVIVTKNE